jgi:hypothetical protein
MVKAMEEHNIHPVVDEKVFTLEHAKEAYEYLVSVLWTELSTNSC